MLFLTKSTMYLNRILTFLAGLILIVMVLLTCANIVFRMFWVPVSGTYELMGFAGAMLTAFALAYTQIKKGHIAVDVLVNVFQPKSPLGHCSHQQRYVLHIFHPGRMAAGNKGQHPQNNR